LIKSISHINQLIINGEGLHLDFKHTISDAYKIAKTICAFANTKGGTLLVGVRDNKTIAGVKSEEEKYMIEMAAQLYCIPPVELKFTEHTIEKKIVLEVIIDESCNKPVFALDAEKNQIVYIRQEDHTFKAGIVTYEWLKFNNKSKNISKNTYGYFESEIMHLMRENGPLKLNSLQNNLPFKKRTIIRSLIKLINLNILSVIYDNNSEIFEIKNVGQ
jgi:predicted HTH transcriptional regulator